MRRRRIEWVALALLASLGAAPAAGQADQAPEFSFDLESSEWSTLEPLQPGDKAAFSIAVARDCPATTGVVLEDQQVVVTVQALGLATEAPLYLDFPMLVCRFEGHQAVTLEIRVTAGLDPQANSSAMAIAIDPQPTENGLHEPGEPKSMVAIWSLVVPPPPPAPTPQPEKESPAPVAALLLLGLVALAAVGRRV